MIVKKAGKTLKRVWEVRERSDFSSPGLLSWIFEKDIQTAEEEISVDGDIVLMRSKGRSLLDAGSGDNSNSINMNKDGEDGTASTYEERNLDAMEEDTWDSNPERSGYKDSAALISQGAHNPPLDTFECSGQPGGYDSQRLQFWM